MKLIVQIPCYNEEKTLPLVIESIPNKISGIDEIEILVIDDGSTDNTIQVAKDYNVEYILKNKNNKGLAYTFNRGIQYCLSQKADIIVNTDGDNQYPQQDIPSLVHPILNGTHDVVIANRQINRIKSFNYVKKFLQNFGTSVVNYAAGTNIPDAASGFRAYSKEAAMQINVVTEFSYSMETIIDAGRNRLSITHIPIRTNPKTRESRLFNNMWQHVYKSASAIVRSYAKHRAFKVFVFFGTILFLLGIVPFIRFIYLTILEGASPSGHIQSLIAGTVLVIVGFLVWCLGILSDLISINRKLIEEIILKMKKNDYK